MKTALKILSLAIVLLLTGYAHAQAANMNLSWTDNSGNETGFEIERCQGSACSSFALIAKVGVNVATYQDTGLTENTTYCYRVRAVNQSVTSGYTNTSCATTLPSTPNAPTGLVVTPVP